MADRSLPDRPDLQQYKKQAKELLKSTRASDRDALRRVRAHHPRYAAVTAPPPDFVLADAQFVIAREHDFDSWPQFAAHVKAMNTADSAVGQFEAAADAIVHGDVAALTRLLARHPQLIRARSTRAHHSTLLHYVGANGVEGYRQRTPKNVVDVAQVLLDAGAEVDAVADMYGGATTLGLVATSAHPRDAGVQNPLIDVFLARGARMDRPGISGGRTPLVNSCLANGRPEAAVYVASRGAPVDLEAAAGLGRFDPGAVILHRRWPAHEWGDDDADARWLLMGVRVRPDGGRAVPDRSRHGCQRAAAAASTDRAPLGGYGPHVETVIVLLRHGSPIDVRDESFGATAIEWTLHGWGVEKRRDERGAYLRRGRSPRAGWRHRRSGVACQPATRHSARGVRRRRCADAGGAGRPGLVPAVTAVRGDVATITRRPWG